MKDNRKMFFTSDEHYSHANVIKFNDRPFKDVNDMNESLIRNHNSVVGVNDVTIHAGDFTLIKQKKRVWDIINKLNGKHIFLKGSHDYWIPRKGSIQIYEKMFDNHYIVICHYAMHTWARSHYNSWHLFGHSHGSLNHFGKTHDVGVDNNDYYPVSMEQIIEIMKDKPDNPNLIKKGS